MKRRFSGKEKLKGKVKPERNIFRDFIPESKHTYRVPNRQMNVDLTTLNLKQRKVYDLVSNHAQRGESPLRLIVCGVGGTGKSHVIHAIRPLLKASKKCFRIFSFTGSSAFNIGGTTFHNGMKLPYFLRGSQPNSNLKAACQALKNVKYIVIDEIGFCGKFLLGMVSERLKLIFNSTEPFGGLSVIAFGDFSQLRPVADPVAYTDYSNCDGLELAGGIAYRSFTTSVFLDEMMRQGPSEAEFRETLLRIRKGELTQPDIDLFSSRVASKVSKEELQEFLQESTALYAEHSDCNRYNEYRLKGLGTEIVEIQSIDTRATIRNPPAHTLRLAVGARIFLNSNLWIETGLYNGALGVVTEIGKQGIGDKAIFVAFVKFDTYIGPRFMLRDDIPIVMTETTEFSTSGETWNRRQLPLALAFSITCHKSQGCTMKKVIIGVPSGNTSLFFRNSPSLFYVACSRVRRSTDLLLTHDFRPELVKTKYSSHLREWTAEENRLLELHA